MKPVSSKIGRAGQDQRSPKRYGVRHDASLEVLRISRRVVVAYRARPSLRAVLALANVGDTATRAPYRLACHSPRQIAGLRDRVCLSNRVFLAR